MNESKFVDIEITDIYIFRIFIEISSIWVNIIDMKKLKFLVLAEEINSDYTKLVIDGISRYCREQEVDVVVCNVRNPKFAYGMFEYQFWAGASLVNTREIDAVIVLSGIYSSTFSTDELAEILSEFKGKKIISISQKLPMENSWTVVSDNELIYSDAFDFLINKAGAKKIAFMDAGKTTSLESVMRFNAYKRCLKEFSMDYDESIVFHGKFSNDSAYTELTERLGENCTDVNFDTLIAANDNMAMGAMAFFRDHGINVPEQVKVMGFDDIDEASAVQPTLSTINPSNGDIGYHAARIALAVSMGEDVERCCSVPAKVVVRESTGYGLCEINDSIRERGSNILVQRTYDDRHIYYMLDSTQCNDTLEVFLTKTEKPISEVDIKRFAVVMFEKPIYNKRWAKFEMPEKVKLEYVFDNGTGTVFKDYYFNPMDNIVPPEIFESSADRYVVQSIFYGEKQYGYLMYSFGKRGLVFYNLYAKALSNALANSYEYTLQYLKNIELEMEKYELEQTSRTDELTGVLNRRGFDIQGEKQIRIAAATGQGGVVIYGDMNNLKMINDKYGHEYGDKAIKAEAEILRSSFRSTDTVGRLGGDEFAVVAFGLQMKKMPDIKKKIEHKCLEAKKKYNFPFDITISLGAVEFGSGYDLNELLKLADEQQYIAKREYHKLEEKN